MIPVIPSRFHLPDERPSITHEFTLYGDDGKEYRGILTVGLFDNGSPGELFIQMDKTGSMVNGLLDTIAIQLSIALQYGIPLEVFVSKFAHARFSPQGMTNDSLVPMAKSLVDYVFRWLELRFLEGEGNDEER